MPGQETRVIGPGRQWTAVMGTGELEVVDFDLGRVAVTEAWVRFNLALDSRLGGG